MWRALSARQHQPGRAAALPQDLRDALHGLGRYDEALDEFQRALALREHSGNAEATRVGRWMVAWTLRGLGRIEEALDIQLGLEQETAAAGQPDPYVFAELEALYRIKGDEAAAARYAACRAEAGEGGA